jgi:hypothetical protein
MEVDQFAIPDRVVARFRAPSRTDAGRPGRVRLRRKKTTLVVSWGRAVDATAYGIVVKQRNGAQRIARVGARKRSITFKNISQAWRGTVTVSARGPTGQWNRKSSRSAAFRATRRPLTVLRDFRRLGRRG